MRRSRLLIIGAGALIGMAAVTAAALAWPQAALSRQDKPACLPYFLIPQEHVCGPNVYLFSNGRRQWIGRLTDFAPMPRPRAFNGVG